MAKRKRRTSKGGANRRRERKDGNQSDYLKLPSDTSAFVIKDDSPKRVSILSYDVGVTHNPYADKGDFHYERTFFTHRGLGASEGTVICPKKTMGKKCPVCEHASSLAGDTAEEWEYKKQFMPKERQLWNVIDHSDKNKKEVQVWDISFHLFGKRLDVELDNADEEDDYDTFADWEDGKILKLGFEEKKFNGNSFFTVDSINFKERKEDYDESTGAVDLDSLLVLKSYDELATMFKDSPMLKDAVENDDDDVEDEIEDEIEDEVEDDVEDEDEDEDEVEDDVEDEVEEEDEVEDEEEEEKPAKKKPAKKKPTKKPAKKKPAKKKPVEEKVEEKVEEGVCPKGHTFGSSCDKENECERCPVWDSCFDAS